jgi:hypothetical protein
MWRNSFPFSAVKALPMNVTLLPVRLFLKALEPYADLYPHDTIDAFTVGLTLPSFDGPVGGRIEFSLQDGNVHVKIHIASTPAYRRQGALQAVAVNFDLWAHGVTDGFVSVKAEPLAALLCQLAMRLGRAKTSTEPGELLPFQRPQSTDTPLL